MALIAIASLLFINISFAANTGKVMVETAKLREQANNKKAENSNAKVLGVIGAMEEEVEILKEEDEWYKVKYKQVTGYIRKDLIQVNNKDAANTNESTKENTTENTVENTTENTQEENDKTIEKVLARHSIVEPDGNTNTELIMGDKKKYIDEYDKEILDRRKNDTYKLIEINEKGFSGYLVAIY